MFLGGRIHPSNGSLSLTVICFLRRESLEEVGGRKVGAVGDRRGRSGQNFLMSVALNPFLDLLDNEFHYCATVSVAV